MAKLEINCAHCNQYGKFVEVADFKQNGWLVIGWNVATTLPIMLCQTCQKNPQSTESTEGTKGKKK